VALKAVEKSKANAARSEGKTLEEDIFKLEAKKIDEQIKYLQDRIDRASLVSPIDGRVLSWKKKSDIGGGVEEGEELYRIAPLKTLYARIYVSEDQVVDLEKGFRGELTVSAKSGSPIGFVVDWISPVAEVVEQKNVFSVRVKLDDNPPWLRPGMEGMAKIKIGDRKYAWIWTRKVVNWVRMKFWL